MSLSNLPLDRSWTLFLDRDGVINRRIVGDYVRSITQFELLPGVIEAIRDLSNYFAHTIIVTNQQGIGKGLMTETDLASIHTYLTNEVHRSGGQIDAILHAPQLKPDHTGYRKPGPGMALAAQEKFPSIDFHKSIMVGDAPGDIAFGKGLGMQTVFIDTPEKDAHPQADFTFNSLTEFAAAIRLHRQQ